MSYSRNVPVPKVLFLTTADPATIRAEWPWYQNWMLPKVIEERGADVDIRCWRGGNLDARTIAGYNAVTFLWCNEYHYHPVEFSSFVKYVLIPAQGLEPSLHIFNDPKIVLWNMDKHYLNEVAECGFSVPKTEFINLCNFTIASLVARLISFSESRPLVLKPTVSGSAYMTRLIKNSKLLASEDEKFLEVILTKGSTADVMLQEYVENISQGEYSVIFINGSHSHTILKTPQAGDFRCQVEFGGSTRELEPKDVPTDALETAHRLMRYLEGRFEDHSAESMTRKDRRLVYARIDGIMKNGMFMLMEIEVIEPDLWLEAESCNKGMEDLCKVFLRSA